MGFGSTVERTSETVWELQATIKIIRSEQQKENRPGKKLTEPQGHVGSSKIVWESGIRVPGDEKKAGKAENVV